MALTGSESLRRMHPAVKLDSRSDSDVDSLLQKVRLITLSVTLCCTHNTAVYSLSWTRSGIAH